MLLLDVLDLIQLAWRTEVSPRHALLDTHGPLGSRERRNDVLPVAIVKSCHKQKISKKPCHSTTCLLERHEMDPDTGDLDGTHVSFHIKHPEAK